MDYLRLEERKNFSYERLASFRNGPPNNGKIIEYLQR